MSMPITFAVPSAPASPAAAGTSATGDSGLLFGDVLSGLADDGGSSDGKADEETLDAMLAAAAAPLGGALLVGLNLPIGDARTLPGSTGAIGVRTAEVAPTPIGGTAVPTTVPATLIPTLNGSPIQGQPATFAVPGQPVGTAAPATPMPSGPNPAPVARMTPSTVDSAVPTTTSSTQNTPATPVPPGNAAPAATRMPPAAQAAAGAAAAAGLTETLAGSVAGAAVPGPAPAAVAQRTEPVVRTAGTQNAVASTVDTGAPAGTGSTVETAVRSGNAFADNGSGQDRGDGALPRGPEAGWAPTLAAARADSAAPTTQAAPAPAAQPQLPPAAQLALRLAPLRAGPDGSHQLTILLHPEELGPVSVVATVKGDQLSVQLTGATEVGRDAMRAALPQLERELRDGGFATLNLNVREAPQPDLVRPTWATPATTAQPAPQPAATQPAAQPAQPVSPTTPVAPTAPDFATDGTATTTTGAKTDGQPIGQTGQPDGSGSIRRDDSTGQYSPAVTAAAQSSGAQFGNTGQQTGNNTGQQSSQQSLQLNLGQPGGQSGQQHHPGLAEQQQQHSGGRHSGPGQDTGQHGPGEPDPRAAEHRTAPGRPENRSVDLRV